MRYITNIFLFLFVFTLAIYSIGCSSLKGPLYKAVSDIPEDKSVVYLYRINDNFNTDFMITYNYEEICVLVNNGYFPFFVEPGKVEISSAVQFKMFATGILDAAIANPTEFVFEAEPGKSYYLKCDASVYTGQELTIKLVPEKFGSNDIKECRLLDPEP
jgi:hypothetical protein